MRVIGGEFRSRRLKTLQGAALRPTPDRLRESLFSVLAPRIGGCVFLDAYAGCGAVGIEALSRGATLVIFVEKHRPAVRLIEENLRSLGAESRAQIVHGPALKHLGRISADIVFFDPPYDLEREYGQALRLLAERPPGLVIAQHSSHFRLDETYGLLRRVRELRQGDNILSFYEPAAGPHEAHGLERAEPLSLRASCSEAEPRK